MHNTKLVVIFAILTVIWMGVIYAFSATPAEKSSSESKQIIRNVVEKVNSNSDNNEKIVNKLNQPLRKVLHGTVYFVLACFIFGMLVNIKGFYRNINMLNVILCFIYACSDEFHQTLVIGRSGEFGYVLIDTFGALLATSLLTFIYMKNRKLPNV